MKIEDTFIQGLKIITPNCFTDVRGEFVKIYNEDMFRDIGISVNIMESYYSVSKKNTIRGMHFQIPPYENSKIVFVSYGDIKDVVLDLRYGSPTYGQYLDISLNATNSKLLLIPPGCAHGFLSISDGTIVNYLQTSSYDKDCDKGIRYNSFGYDWKTSNPIISSRDSELDLFTSYITPF